MIQSCSNHSSPKTRLAFAIAALLITCLHAPAALKGEYFAGRALNTPLLQRTDANIGFSWGEGSPAPGIPDNEFSARWTGFLTAAHTGTYTLYIVSDNGSRLKLNGRVISDEFDPDGGTDVGWTIRDVQFTAGQRVPFDLEYYESTGGAELTLYWYSVSQAFEVIPASAFALPDAPPPAAKGWTGRYFDGRQFEKPVLTRAEAGIDFEWSGAPADGLFPVNFSVKWSGLLTPAFSETYTFTIAADNGTRLWIDGKLVSSAWDVPGGEDGGWRSVQVPLTGGKPVPILLDYYQSYGSASAALYWTSASQPWEIVPGSSLTALSPDPSPWIGDLPPLQTLAGTAVSLPIQASQATGAALTYTASGLPPGVTLAIESWPHLNGEGLPPVRTPVLQGRPWLPGLYQVIVAASSPMATVETAFSWTITGPGVDPGPDAAVGFVQSTLLLVRNENPARLNLSCILPETITHFYAVSLQRSNNLTAWENRTDQAGLLTLPGAFNNPKRESLLSFQEPLPPDSSRRLFFRIRLDARR